MVPQSLFDKFSLKDSALTFSRAYRYGYRIYEVQQEHFQDIIVSFSEVDKKGKPAEAGKLFVWVKPKTYVMGNLVAFPTRDVFAKVSIDWLLRASLEEWERYTEKLHRKLR